MQSNPKPKKYAEIDAAILQQIARGKRTFTQIQTTAVTRLARMASEHEPWRVIDRRLQSMRKAGKISYLSSVGWRITGESA